VCINRREEVVCFPPLLKLLKTIIMERTKAIEILNEHFSKLKSVVRFDASNAMPTVIDIIITDPFIKRSPMSAFTDSFYEELNDVAKNKFDCEITTNNTGSCFWSFKEGISVFQ
jgi:hypothetical protein